MTSATYPSPAGLAPREREARSPASSSSPLPPGAWRYSCRRRSRTFVIAALVFSAGLHAFLLFGWSQRKKPVTRPPASAATLIALVVPEVKELEPEPEVVPGDPADVPPEFSPPVPMQADLPQLPQPSDFIQKIDFSSLIERPDLGDAKIMTIPDTPRRGGKIVENMGSIFNLSDLDRVPEALYQPPPAYPHLMQRDTSSATVVVEFIVNVEGRVTNAFAYESTHPGFNDAAIKGVEKWKFRAGQKAGRKVNTRMRVPINFSADPYRN